MEAEGGATALVLSFTLISGLGQASVVVLPDVEPVADYIDPLSEGDCDIRIARRVAAVVARIAAEYGRTKLNNRRRASRIGSGSHEVSRVVVSIRGTVVDSED